MARAKAPVYDEENTPVNEDLAKLLREAVDKLLAEMLPIVQIKRSHHVVGYGVSKLTRSISADAVIAVARAIKSLKGW